MRAGAASGTPSGPGASGVDPEAPTGERGSYSYRRTGETAAEARGNRTGVMPVSSRR
jgi:hypothetical protein